MYKRVCAIAESLAHNIRHDRTLRMPYYRFVFWNPSLNHKPILKCHVEQPITLQQIHFKHDTAEVMVAVSTDAVCLRLAQKSYELACFTLCTRPTEANRPSLVWLHVGNATII